MSANAVEQLQEKIESLESELEALRPKAVRADELEAENQLLAEQIAWFKRYFLHRKADVVEDESQQPLPFNEAEVLSEPPEADVQTITAYTRSKPVRKPLPKDMPRVREIIDLRDDEKVCGCGHQLVRIGEETSE